MTAGWREVANEPGDPFDDDPSRAGWITAEHLVRRPALAAVTDDDNCEEAGASWRPVDLAGVVTGLRSGDLARPTPTVCALTNGACLFYAGRVNSVFGDSGSAKSWLLLVAAAQELAAGRHVAWCDYEDDAIGTVGRLLDLGANPDRIVTQLHYIQPDEYFGPDAEAIFRTLSTELELSLVVIDSTGEAMGLEGRKVNDDLDNAQWSRRVPRTLAGLGPAVVTVDHVVKNKDTRGLDPAGSYRKRAGINGAAYLAEMGVEFGVGRAGISRLTVAKDRLGNWTRGSRAADFHLDATTLPYSVELRPPTDSTTPAGDFRPTYLMERVSRWLEINPGASGNAIEKAVAGNAAYIRKALTVLVEEGFVKVETRGRGRHYRVDSPFREETE